MRVHISEDGLRSLMDMDMLHSDVLVTTVAKAAIGLELVLPLREGSFRQTGRNLDIRLGSCEGITDP